MSRWKNACEAYWWIYNHPKLTFDEVYHPWVDITHHMVNPDLIEDGCAVIDTDPTKNTKMEFWVECGSYTRWDEDNLPIPTYDYELDCGGWTWEEAVLNLAQKVLEKYGDYPK